jgi:hypothetical protein
VYIGNFEYDATEREIERLFEKYGKLERVDMKTGNKFCCPVPGDLPCSATSSTSPPPPFLVQPAC